jgi:hypothetical protein
MAAALEASSRCLQGLRHVRPEVLKEEEKEKGKQK